MTQVANLMAGMTVSAKGNASFLKQDQSQLVIEEFASIMNQNTQGFLNSATDYEMRAGGGSDDGSAVEDAADALHNDYERLGSSGGRKIAQSQTQDADSEDVSGKMQTLAEDVKETVKETMQVSDEQIRQAMEALGFTALDLLLPQNLVQMVQQLTGNMDVGALLTNETFQVIMQDVTALITDFQQENGWNAVQFSDLLEQLSAQIDDLEETVKELLSIDETAQQPQQQAQQMTEALSDQSYESPAEPAADQQVAEIPEQINENVEISAEKEQTQTVVPSAVEQQNVTTQTVSDETQDESAKTSEQTMDVPVESLTEETAQTTEQQEQAMSQGDDKAKQPSSEKVSDQKDTVAEEQHVGIVYEGHTIANDPAAVAKPDTAQAVQNYVELEQLMDQLEGLARTFASTEGTTVEMQLNPENLGRLVLTVTEKSGNVTAQITASNEQVKEALQTQMAELRSTLQAQGIKVEAVEVTVRSHEFEQNLDGNTSANGQMQEQAGEQENGSRNGRRNLTRNSLDEMSGLMSEEETLVAQMMRDQGGSVDFTA